ncbi:mycothiol system anti-sigma-R factor [Planomonospora venezuelensis]|uniref:Mycothiol system anti-sigma-R factor n=1 Tax=Planomonospora venezuelensis TaxID=1999 RepID=A0A841DA09_PLAVE|nr:mycothiol system anti-sigma-R factor [Planomonospora venezuelensis]MBB5966319.1 mycothiol system anti-sigma-R factor [Planomonospora venezuelensis]GIN04607.1 anti-sigma factor RsrA [Planomonospora venezuelensis]
MSCGDHHDTDCREVLEKVYTYLDGELDEGNCVDIRQHLDECSPCLKEYGLEQVVKQLVARHCGCDPVPDDLRSKILSRIDQVRSELAT